MHRAACFAALLLLVSAHPSFAQGIHLRWTNCVADGGVRNMAFACNSNAGTAVLVCSFEVPEAVTMRGGVAGVVDVVASGGVLPAWWNFVDCRSGSIHLNIAAATPVLCPSLLATCLGSEVFESIVPGVPAANAERLTFSRSNCTGFPHVIAVGEENVGGVLSLSFDRTVDSPSCTGCGAPVCLILNQMIVFLSGPNLILTYPAIPPDGNVVTWQGAGFTPGGACLAATPTRRSAWGAVKALYR